MSEQYPVSEQYKVLDGYDIYRSENLLIAIVVVEGNVPGAVLDRIYTDSTERANEIISKATEIARSEGVDSNAQILSNVRSIVQAIVEYSERNKADLIVLGTRGMSGFKRLLLGSVSSGVANHASCSVLIVR